MNLRHIALTTALLFAFAICGAAQIGPFGQANNDQTAAQDAQAAAYRSGTNDGMKDGRTDAQNGVAYRATDTDHYRKPPAYASIMSGMNYDQYQQEYRQAYVQAYQQSYGRIAQNGYPQQNYPVNGQQYPQQNYPNNGQQYPQQNYPVYGQQYPNEPVYSDQGQYGMNMQNAFNEGVGDGQSDARGGISYRPTGTQIYRETPGYDRSSGISKNDYRRAFRDAYARGYQQGYSQYANNGYPQQNSPVYGQQYPQQNYPVYGQPGYPNGRDRGGDRDDDDVYRQQTGVYGQQNGGNAAFQRGYQDGVNDGANDRQSGHSYRPQKSENYEHTPGYNSSSGVNKGQWKQAYRQGYVNGYQRSYQPQ